MIRFITLSFIVFVVSAFAGDGSFNYYGQLGFHKTQSAQTLGHGRFGVGLFAEGMGLHSMIENGQICVPEQGSEKCDRFGGNYVGLGGTYIGLNAYPFVSLGLSNIFDFAISLPIYGEIVEVKHESDGGNSVGLGDFQILTKLRVPLDSLPFDVSAVIGAAFGTGFVDYYRFWVRDPAFLNKDTVYKSMSYTNSNIIFKGGVAATLDLNRLNAEIPLRFHLNYMLRMTLGQSGQEYPFVHTFATALEWTPVQYISLFAEWYTDMLKFPNVNIDGYEQEDFAATSTITLGTALNFSKHVTLQLGLQMLIGDENEYINNLSVPMDNNRDMYGYYNAALIPKYLVFGGLNFKIFVVEPEKEEEKEEEKRNPDTDGDGVCDPWVARESRQREYSRTCKGIDLCPYEEGEISNKGCPEEEEEEDAPTIKFDVSEESISVGQSATLIWMVANADEVSIEPSIGEVESEGRKRVRPKETTKYTITATGSGGTKKKSIEVVVESAAGPSVEFSASSESVQKGQPVTLTWMVTDATEVNIEGIGKVKNSGTRNVKPSATGVTTFTLTATGPGGTKTEAVEVEVLGGPLPVILFTASSENITNGQTVTLSWQVSNATEVIIEGLGKVPAKGTKKLKPTETTGYKLVATGEGGTETAVVEVEVEEPPPAPVIEAKVNLQGVTFGSGNATLTPNAKTILDGIAEQLLAYPKVRIEIHGYTDNQGDSKTNLELSERRARAVVGYLAIRGVKMNRMSAIGFGQDNPIADNKTKEGRELNRRIEMIRVDD
ncbi:MAG: OmpA family protein [Fibromonadales bacterium]|nr:OmpA family protein [Fibromonadales bacterium]